VSDERNDHLYSIDQAAAFLQIHRATLYRLIAAGKIAYFRLLSKRIRLSRAQLQEFLRANERNASKLRTPRRAI
jgi:excisionase family DNA binding protein